jgi:hypothetical protein
LYALTPYRGYGSIIQPYFDGPKIGILGEIASFRGDHRIYPRDDVAIVHFSVAGSETNAVRRCPLYITGCP